MTKEITKKLEDQDWYQSLIDDCKSLLTEGIHNYRLTLIRVYHFLGRRILQDNNNFQREKIYGERLCHTVAESLGQSERTIWRALQFVKKYPDLDKFIDATKEQKVLSWHKIVQYYLSEPKENKIELPKGKFNIIYADPPWQYWEGGDKNQSRHYKTLTKDEIINYQDKKGRKISDLAADDCILFIWATFPALREAIEVIEAWGFEYSTVGFVWVKSKQDGTGFAFGNGSWTRANVEICLIGTKGIIERKDKTISQIIYEPRRDHSEKPDIVREKIVQLVGILPRTEAFGRKKVPGWAVWGDKI